MSRGEKRDRALIVSERVYKVLLITYPKESRREYGSQMVQDFRDLCREEVRRDGTGGLVRWWSARSWIW